MVDEPYGVCLYLDESGQPWAVLNGKDGLFVQFELHPDHSVSEARRWRTRTQPEGCVADDDTGLLYVGEENHGVWTLSADPRQPAELAVFAKVADGILSADVEGMALYRAPGETRTDLVVSSQGDSSFAVYDTTSGAHRGSFRVGGHDAIDAVSDTDGIASKDLGIGESRNRTAARESRRRSAVLPAHRRGRTPFPQYSPGTLRLHVRPGVHPAVAEFR